MSLFEFELEKGLPIKLLLDRRPIGMSLQDRMYAREIISRSGFPSYVEE